MSPEPKQRGGGRCLACFTLEVLEAAALEPLRSVGPCLDAIEGARRGPLDRPSRAGRAGVAQPRPPPGHPGGPGQCHHRETLIPFYPRPGLGRSGMGRHSVGVDEWCGRERRVAGYRALGAAYEAA